MTLEELKRLAEIVYPDQAWDIFAGTVYEPDVWSDGSGAVPFEECLKFNPSLTGPAEQKAQALDCIVAAFNHKDFIKLDKLNSPPGLSFMFSRLRTIASVNSFEGRDLLQAASRALLAKGVGE